MSWGGASEVHLRCFRAPALENFWLVHPRSRRKLPRSADWQQVKLPVDEKYIDSDFSFLDFPETGDYFTGKVGCTSISCLGCKLALTSTEVKPIFSHPTLTKMSARVIIVVGGVTFLGYCLIKAISPSPEKMKSMLADDLKSPKLLKEVERNNKEVLAAIQRSANSNQPIWKVDRKPN